MKKEREFPSKGLVRFQEWKNENPNGFPKWAYIRNEIRAEDAVLLSTFFWPDLIERDGMVLLGEHFNEQSYIEHRKNLNWNPYEYEAIVNHLHLEDFFADEELFSRSLLIYLGNVLQEIWAIRLSCAFPEREFDVSFDYSEKHDQYVISFQTKNHAVVATKNSSRRKTE